MENEVWKDIIGFQGYYQISNTGYVKSLQRYYIQKRPNEKIRSIPIRERLLKPSKQKCGYMLVTLQVNTNVYYRSVHRLVAEHFIPNPENKPQVNHKDLNKINNTVSNLEWASRSENIRHSYDNGRNVGVKPIQMLCKKSMNVLMEFSCVKDAAKYVNRGHCNISSCANGKLNTAYGYKWKFKMSKCQKILSKGQMLIN